MRTVLGVALLLVCAAVARALPACGDESECWPGDYRGCECADGGWGYARCAPADTFSDTGCVCDGTTPGVAPAPVSPDAEVACVPDAGGKEIFEPCSGNAECGSCLCEILAGSGRCTRACSADDPCPNATDVCTTRGLCRPGP